MDYKKNIAKSLLKAGAFKISFDPLFTWTSGIKSPVYCDLRALISDVDARSQIISAFLALLPAGVDVIAGTATAGIPWAAWIAEKAALPMVYVRSEAKEHGTKRRIEGILSAGQKVVLIEDHISTGKSSVSAITALREEAGAVVENVLAINTYELSAAAEVYNLVGVKVSTVINYSVILGESGLSAERIELLMDFRNDPASWAEKHGL